ncbi:hypothetical protein K1T73_08805 [Roseovarius sp. SCSIO 43702]|uniref:hypothetical protein n=1 Tax=Roseovarius sp. SCSIO 43702 TaxID=2823043 RepID=UPI001C7311AB|nr:hypothetical protein [Roseovarius sp. SCSIO 43702]QYX58430.1 hypothetical protein K1T73_08805 [Roseovarius sp. SCSIO 43702]
MVVAVSAFIGAALGAYQARRRKGAGADMAQYALVYALLFSLAALFASIVMARMST